MSREIKDSNYRSKGRITSKRRTQGRSRLRWGLFFIPITTVKGQVRQWMSRANRQIHWLNTLVTNRRETKSRLDN